MANNADTLTRALDNYCRIWLMLTELIACPTQANIDTLLSTAEGLGVVRPKTTSAADGESYNWLEYQQALGQIMSDLRKQIILSQGPFWVNSVGR